MITYGRVACKGLVPVGVSVSASIWMREYTSSKISSTISTQATNAAMKRSIIRPGYPRAFSTTSTNIKKVAPSVPSTSRTTSSSMSTMSIPKKRPFLDWYEGRLASRPIATKMSTGAVLWGVGDAVAQVIPPIFYPSKNKASIFQYDHVRSGRAILFGCVLHAPTSHAHYNFLEWLTVRLGFKGLQIPVFKVIMEQFVYWSWVSNSMYHGAMGAMQGLNANQIYHRIEDVLWDTQKAQWVFWIPVQLLNFQFVPVRHQLNVVLLTSIVWTALLSAWYPPVMNHDKKEETERIKKETR